MRGNGGKKTWRREGPPPDRCPIETTMVNSFLKSLPSHKKKRKLRHRERRTGSQSQNEERISQKLADSTTQKNEAPENETNADVSFTFGDEIEEQSDRSLLSDEESCVPGTEFQGPMAVVDTNKSPRDEEAAGVYSQSSGRNPDIDGSDSYVNIPRNEQSRENILPQIGSDLTSNASKCGPNGVFPYRVGSHEASSQFSRCSIKSDQNIDQSAEIQPDRHTSIDNTSEVLSVTSYGSSAQVNQDNIDGVGALSVEHSFAANKQASARKSLKKNKSITSKIRGELVITPSDVALCIDEIKAAATRKEKDLFTDIDLDSFQATLQSFHMYLVSLSKPGSVEAASLEELTQTDRAFSIFEQGMDVNHCNVCFICDMIRHIAADIQSSGEDSTKLHELIECMEYVYGVGDSNDNDIKHDVTVSILKYDDTSKLSFKRESHMPIKTPAVTPLQLNNALPPHLHEVHYIFERYTNQKTKSLQAQLDSSRMSLEKTREGAIQLQKTALELQDQLQHARLEADEAISRQNEFETAFNKQRYEFEKKLESFERVKVHYKRLLGEKERELTAPKGLIGQQMTVHSMSKEELQLVSHISRNEHLHKHRQEEGANTAAARIRQKNKRSNDQPSATVPKNDSSNQESQSISKERQSKQSFRQANDRRNPLGSLTSNSSLCQPTHGISRRSSIGKSSNAAVISKIPKSSHSTGRKPHQIQNPHSEQPRQEVNESDKKYDFPYHEVVRGKAARAALPAHECDECRKFNDAVYAQTGADMPGRAQMVNECSRHRSRFAPALTPADYWEMDFIDER